MGAKRALVVGINNYQGNGNDLPSCINDAQTMKQVLQDHFAFEGVKILTDAQASMQGINDSLDELFKGVGPDDRVVFYFSGHGYRAASSGVMEECIVTSDLNFLWGKDFSTKTQSLPPGVLTVILDSCFSGGMQKLFQLHLQNALAQNQSEAVKALHQQIRHIKFYVPPGEAFVPSVTAKQYMPFGGVAATAVGPHLPERKSLVVSHGAGDERKLVNGLLLTACSEGEEAAASTPDTVGRSAFTFAFTKAIADGGNASAKELMAKAAITLRQINVSQTPQTKEPPKPAGMSDLSLVTLAALTAKNVQSSGDLVSTLVETLRTYFSKELPQMIPTNSPFWPGLSPGFPGCFPPNQVDFAQKGLDLNTILQLVTSIASAAGGAGKGFAPLPSQVQQAKGIDFGDIVHILQVAGQVAGAIGGKGLQLPAAQQAKGIDFGTIINVIQTAAQIASAVGGKGFQPVQAQQEKGFDLGDVVHTIQVIGQIAGAVGGKGFQSPGETPDAVSNKGFWDVVGKLAPVIIALAA